MVKSILEKFKGQEQKLYKGLKRKYRHAPKVLLLSEGAIALQKNNPLKWSAQKLKGWIRKLQNGRFEQYADKFNMSGSKFFSLSVHDVIDRCGGGSHCAAFNDSEHALYARSSSSTSNNVDGAERRCRWSKMHNQPRRFLKNFESCDAFNSNYTIVPFMSYIPLVWRYLFPKTTRPCRDDIKFKTYCYSSVTLLVLWYITFSYDIWIARSKRLRRSNNQIGREWVG